MQPNKCGKSRRLLQSHHRPQNTSLLGYPRLIPNGREQCHLSAITETMRIYTVVVTRIEIYEPYEYISIYNYKITTQNDLNYTRNVRNYLDSNTAPHHCFWTHCNVSNRCYRAGKYYTAGGIFRVQSYGWCNCKNVNKARNCAQCAY